MSYTAAGLHLVRRLTEILLKIETVVELTSTTGVPLDLDFGVKAVRGMIGEMNKNPERFAGKRILYLQTGTLVNSNATTHN